jgi:peroxiredoxin
MVRTASTMLPLGTKAPCFSLFNTNASSMHASHSDVANAKHKLVSLSDFEGKRALVVVFMCNHCPYVKHVAPELAHVSKDYMAKEVGFVGISSNDVSEYPQDGPDWMAQEASDQGYPFPYLLDADQSIAMAYHAACTPDIFVFDSDMRLVYRGQLDDSRPKNGIPLSGKDLRSALDCILMKQPVSEVQKPSIGCNIKWKQGAEPEYFNPVGIGG